MSKSKSKTTSNQTTNQTATTTPNVPSWMQQGQQNYFGQVDALANSGQPFVAGASPLQQQAFSSAANLGAPQFSFQQGQPQTSPIPTQGKGGVDGPQIAGGGGDGYTPPQTQAGGTGGNSVFDLAGMLGLNAGTAGPNTTNGTALAQASGYQGQGYNPAAQGTAQGYNPQAAASANSYNPSGPAAVNGYTAAQAQGQGYQAQGYDPTTGTASGYEASLLDPSQLGMDRAQMGAIGQASSQGFTQAGLQERLNPFLDQVQGAFTADFDANAGRTRAAQSSQAAFNGGARNSNNAIMQAVTEGELARARGSGVAGIQSDGFNTAAGILGQDNDRSAQTSIANAGFTTQGALAQFDADNSRNQLLTQLGFQGAQANQNAQNTASQFGAAANNQFGMANMDAANTASQFGANANNQASQFNSDLMAQLSQFNAGSANQASQFGANAGNAAALDFAGRSDQAGQFGADAANRAGLDFAGRADQAGQFGAGEANRFALDAAGRQDAAGQFGANAANQANQFGANAQNQASQFNAGSINQNSQFNAGQQDNALMRQLQAAGLMGDLGNSMGANDRANIALQGQLGGEQRGITNAQSQQEYARLAALQQLYGVNANALIGQTQTGSGTQSGTNTTRQSGFSLGWNPATGLSLGG